MFLTTTIATLTLMCSPQPDKQIKHTCIIWMKEEIEYLKSTGLTEDQAIEASSEQLPQELWPK